MLYESISTGQKLYTFAVPTPFSVGPVNVYLLKGESLTLIDVGPKTAEAKEYLSHGLKQLGYSMKEIEQIVLTHHHPDHCGLLDEFEQAKIIGHRNNAPWISKDKAFFKHIIEFFLKFYKEHGVEAEIIEKIKRELQFLMRFSCERKLAKELSDGDEIEGMPGWKVVETLGHAQSHISLHHTNKALMIAGDHLIKHVASNAIIEAPYPHEVERPKTLIQYRKSLRGLKDLQLLKVFAGHGDVIEQPNDLIDLRLRRHEERAEEILKLLGHDEYPAFELCKMLFPKVYMKQPDLTFSETIGHLDFLEEMNKVKKEVREGVTYFFACRKDLY